jgi:hypothetical protein
MTFDNGDLQVLADRLLGSQDNIHEHVVALGIETDCASTVMDELLERGFVDICDECGIWERPLNLDGGLCGHCFDEQEDEIAAELEDEEEDDFGFGDDAFLDFEDIDDECIADCIFDETDEDDL